ncbi:MAG: FecR domain-containing protein [Verrucomicrobia bacterium]|nr:FecR domain-containing protein [Verrucomicrobiota bacterium]
MSESLDHEDPIEEVASDWLTQRAEGFSSAQKRDFERWCRADPRHAAAVARLEAACALLEKMPLVRAELQPVVEFPVKPRSIAPVKRFPLLRVVFAMAAALALAAFGWWQWADPQPAAQLYATSTGGYERVVLADGSVVELNANSEVRVELLPNARRVALVQGEAHFTVAHDIARPFIVSAHGVAVRAVGTAFNVRLAATAVEVLVTEGKVSVSDVGPALAAGPSRSERDNRDGLPTSGSPTFLSANERTVIPFAPPKSLAVVPALVVPVVEKITSYALREALSWQERKLVFSETPLHDVVAQFNRHNRLQLVLGDAALAERPVGGTFAADNVEGFVRLLEGSGTIAVERRDEMTVVLRAVR